MLPRAFSSLGGLLVGTVLVVAACGGAAAPTAVPSATRLEPIPTSAASVAAPTTTVPTAASTLQPTVEGVRNGRIAYGVRSSDGANIFSVLPDGTGVVQLTTAPATACARRTPPTGARLPTVPTSAASSRSGRCRRTERSRRR